MLYGNWNVKRRLIAACLCLLEIQLSDSLKVKNLYGLVHYEHSMAKAMKRVGKCVYKVDSPKIAFFGNKGDYTPSRSSCLLVTVQLGISPGGGVLSIFVRRGCAVFQGIVFAYFV